MKILWLSQNLPFPPKTGVLQRNYNLLREASRFADVSLVGVLKPDVIPGYRADVAVRELSKICSGVEAVALPAQESRAVYMSIAALSIVTPTPFTTNWAWSRALPNAVRAARARVKPDLVFFDTISLAGARRVTGSLPSVLNHHNVESQLFERRVNFEPNSLRRRYLAMEARKLRSAEARLMPQFTVNVAVSELDADRLREISPLSRVDVIANGVDIDYFTAGDSPPRPGSLVMVGGMNWFPNRDAALHMIANVWPRIATEIPHASLTIVGADPPEPVLGAAAADPRVRVPGFVDDIRPYIADAEVYLCPMRDGGGTRLKILDALAMGKPIVATTMAMEGIGAIPERDVLIADDPEAFVAQVRRLIADPALRARIGASGRALAEARYSWRAVGETMRAVFQRAIDEGRERA